LFGNESLAKYLNKEPYFENGNYGDWYE
jgi:hypothetical protein